MRLSKKPFIVANFRHIRIMMFPQKHSLKKKFHHDMESPLEATFDVSGIYNLHFGRVVVPFTVYLFESNNGEETRSASIFDTNRFSEPDFFQKHNHCSQSRQTHHQER